LVVLRMKQTPFFEKHTACGARMVEFSGWQMPIQYPDGIVAEHLATRKHAGLFDVSHMGRFHVSGAGAPAFLRYALTNDCDRLAVGHAHYTMLANEEGGAIDDAFLYRLSQEAFLLVVNAMMLGLVSVVFQGFTLGGFWSAIFGAIFVSFFSWLASAFIGKNGRYEVIVMRR